MTPEIWMLLHEVGAFLQWAWAFLQWAWAFAPIPAILWLFSVAGLLLCFLWPMIGEVEDGPVLPERK